MTLILLFSYQVLFIGMGRTSYLTYLLLMTLFVIQVFSWRKLVLALLLVASFVCIIYKESTIMNQRVHEAIQDWQGFHNHTVKDTPVGFRLQFHAYAHTLFNHHPLIGTGTSGFSASFKKDQPVPGWGKKTLFEPHSQYWLMAVDWGLMGLALFISFFVSLLLACWRRVETRSIGLGLIASFLMGSFLDSLLLYSGTGYFFLLFMALSLAGGTKTLPASSIVSLVGGVLHGLMRYKPGRT
jgi:O-antigen ligase